MSIAFENLRIFDQNFDFSSSKNFQTVSVVIQSSQILFQTNVAFWAFFENNWYYFVKFRSGTMSARGHSNRQCVTSKENTPDLLRLSFSITIDKINTSSSDFKQQNKFLS